MEADVSNTRQQWLDRSVVDLLGLENEIEIALQRVLEMSSPHVGASMSEVRDMVAAHRDRLLSYLGSRDAETGGAGNPAAPLSEASKVTAGHDGLANTLPRLFAAFSYAAMSYAALFEAALRLYDEELRELAQRHQDHHANAAYLLAGLVAPVVAAELAAQGMECQCVCPMCSLGVCGCVAVGGIAATSSLREPENGTEPGRGFRVESPRRGSQLAEAGAEEGDRLVEVDGEPVTTVFDIQTAIRKHRIGDTVQLLIARGEDVRQIEVTHVHDYSA